MQSINRPLTPEDQIICTSYFSWTAVIVGGFVAFGLGFLLDLFSKGIGLSLYTNNTSGATTLAIGGFIALILGAIATMFTAGFAAGFFAGPTCGKRNFGVVYGFVAWALGLLLMGLFAANVTNAITSKVRFDSSTAQEVTQTSENVTTRVHPATDAADTTAEKRVRATGIATIASFLVFFIGALAACFGGVFGFSCWDKWNHIHAR